MDLSKLQAHLIKEEGLKLKVYPDSLGIPTIGVGRNLRDKGLSASEAMYLLDNDMKEAVTFVAHNLPWWTSLDEVRQLVLVDMVFNLGGRLLGFKNFLAALQSHDWSKASAEMLNSTWAIQVGGRAKVLARMIETGKD